MFIDSHCHLDYFKDDARIERVISDAYHAQITTMLCVSVTLAAHSQMMRIVHRHERIYASIGLHPCHVSEESVTAQQLIDYANNDKKIIAIGESGLDYFRKPYDEEQQKQNFIAHIQAAQQTQLPLIVHNRNADDDVITLLEEHYAKQAFPCILHCFTGSEAMMKRAISMGFYISFSGIITFKSAKSLQETAKHVPDELLLIETDSPYLAPETMRGKTNEPQYLILVAEKLAQLRQTTKQAIAQQTSDNFMRLMTKIASVDAV